MPAKRGIVAGLRLPSKVGTTMRAVVAPGQRHGQQPRRRDRSSSPIELGSHRPGVPSTRLRPRDEERRVFHLGNPHAVKNSARSAGLVSYAPRQIVVRVMGEISRTPRISVHR